MVWKRLTVCLLVCALAAMLALPAAASAASYTPYDGNIPSDCLDIADKLFPKKSSEHDYVFFRSGVNSYMFVTGDLTYEGLITGTDCRSWQLIGTTDTGYQLISTQEAEFTLDPGYTLIYSNPGDFPDLISDEDRWIFLILFSISVLTVMFLVSRIFSFNLRMRVSV